MLTSAPRTRNSGVWNWLGQQGKNLHIIVVRMNSRRIVAQDLLLRAKTLRHVDQFQSTISISRYEEIFVEYLEVYRRKEEFDNMS
jgi:hypothetical protein